MPPLLSWISSFLTVASLAGLVSLLSEHLCRTGNQKKLRYLCALAVVASIAAPLPGFLTELQSAAESGRWAEHIINAAENGTAAENDLGSKLFSEAAAGTLQKNAGDELREKLSLEEEDLALFFTVGRVEKEEKAETSENGSEENGDLLFSVQSVKAELYTPRAIAKTAEIKAYLDLFSCPVVIEERLLA